MLRKLQPHGKGESQARLLFRMTDGQLFKQYTDDIPEWAKTLIDV